MFNNKIKSYKIIKYNKKIHKRMYNNNNQQKKNKKQIKNLLQMKRPKFIKQIRYHLNIQQYHMEK